MHRTNALIFDASSKNGIGDVNRVCRFDHRWRYCFWFLASEDFDWSLCPKQLRVHTLGQWSQHICNSNLKLIKWSRIVDFFKSCNNVFANCQFCKFITNGMATSVPFGSITSTPSGGSKSRLVLNLIWRKVLIMRESFQKLNIQIHDNSVSACLLKATSILKTNFQKCFGNWPINMGSG